MRNTGGILEQQGFARTAGNSALHLDDARRSQPVTTLLAAHEIMQCNNLNTNYLNDCFIMPHSTALPDRQRLLMFTMAQVNKQWRRTLDKALAPMGLTQALWLPLLHLERGEGPMRQKDLAHSLALDSSSVVRLIDGLQAQGWVERLDDADRRVKRIQLTAAGHTQVEAVKKVVTRVRTDVMRDFPAELLGPAQTALESMLDKMAALEAETEKDSAASDT